MAETSTRAKTVHFLAVSERVYKLWVTGYPLGSDRQKGYLLSL